MPRRIIFVPLALLVLGGATVAQAPTLSPELLARLKGRTAGTAVDCVQLTDRTKVSIVDSQSVLFSRGSTTFVNFPACGSLRPSRALVFGADSRRVCEGDDAQVFDLRSDISYGACRMGRFVPFKRAKK